MDEKKQKQPLDQILEEQVKSRDYELNYISVVLFLFALVGIGLLFILLSSTMITTPSLLIEAPDENDSGKSSYVDPFENIVLEGKAAYVYDVHEQKTLFSLNEELQLPLASITKLMTVLTASDYIKKDETVTIGYDSLNVEGDNGLFAFEEWLAKDLFDFTLVVSSNDGATALASVAGGAKIVRTGKVGDTPQGLFVDEMNKLAQEIGLKQTYFINETGLDPNKQLSGSYGSARDTSKLLEYILINKPRLIEATAYSSIDFISESQFEHTATNTNNSIGSIPGLIASKTGFTDLAGGNLIIAFDAGINRPIIVSILGSSKEGRFIDVEKLVAASLRAIQQ